MEQKKKSKCTCLFHDSFFPPRKCECISHNLDISSQNCEFILNFSSPQNEKKREVECAFFSSVFFPRNCECISHNSNISSHFFVFIFNKRPEINQHFILKFSFRFITVLTIHGTAVNQLTVLAEIFYRFSYDHFLQ